MLKLHIDTDLGGDIDDLCAMAMVLKWPDADLRAVTTVSDDLGKRAGYARYVLNLAGRGETPVAAGADVSQGYFTPKPELPMEEDYWPEPVPPLQTTLDQTLDLLETSIRHEAALVTIGPLTNLALLERRTPGILKDADLFIMGGLIYPMHPGFPDLSIDMDWNIQVDIVSSLFVLQNSNPTLIPLSVTVETCLRRSQLPSLRRSDQLAQLIAHQAVAFDRDENYARLFGQTYAGLPEDMINFLHDPLACAIALRWRDGIEIAEVPLVYEIKDDGYMHQEINDQGAITRVVTNINGPKFNQFWFDLLLK